MANVSAWAPSHMGWSVVVVVVPLERGVVVGHCHAPGCLPQLPLCLQDAASPKEQQLQAPAAPPKPWSTFKAMTLGSLPSAQWDRLELRCTDWGGPCTGLDVADGDFQTEV